MQSLETFIPTAQAICCQFSCFPSKLFRLQLILLRVPVALISATWETHTLLWDSRKYSFRTCPAHSPYHWVFWLIFISWFHTIWGQILMCFVTTGFTSCEWGYHKHPIPTLLCVYGRRNDSTTLLHECYLVLLSPFFMDGLTHFLTPSSSMKQDTFVVHMHIFYLLLASTADSSACSSSFKGCSGILPGHLNTNPVYM